MSSTFINNQWVEGQGEVFSSTTPDETNVLWQKAASSKAQVIEAVTCARDAQKGWANTNLSGRIEIIQKFAGVLKDKQESLASTISLETGKPRWEALTEVAAMINKVSISIRSQEERAGTRSQNHLSLNHHAHGVMAVFGPFNFPAHLPNGHIVPALLAGNTVVFKPSELTPLVAEITVQAWQEAGLPKGVINLIQGGKEVGQTLASADVNGILFTGSYETGKAIHRQLAGKPEVLLALEMGGNNPLIVGEINDTDVAANTVLHSAFLSAGQRCTCTRRLILVESDASDALLDKLVGMSTRIIVGDTPEHSEPFMGPVINTLTANKLLQAEEDLIQKGAKSLLKITRSNHVYLTPGILDVSEISDIDDDEHFGPLLQVYRAKNFDDAIQIANDTKFGLAAGLISDSPDEHEQFKRQIQAGIISINLPTAGASSELPFGGIGASGNHRPSAYYAADYCAWPQATSLGADTKTQAGNFDIQSIRGLR